MKFIDFSAYKVEAKKLLLIALPILLAQIAQNSMGLVDTIMSGRVSSADMAAISVGASIWFPLVLFGHGLLLALHQQSPISMAQANAIRLPIKYDKVFGLFYLVAYL